MKKTLAFLTALILVSASLVGYMANALLFQGENVVFTLTEETGDKSFLEGVSTDLKFSYKGHLIWDVGFDPLGDTKTQLTFKKLQTYDNTQRYFGINYYFADVLDLARDNEEIGNYVGDIKEQLTRDGDSKTFTVKMSDYYDYYPLKPDVSLPGISISYDTYFSPTEKSGYSFSGISAERGTGFIRALKSFLKIPVYEEDIRTETVGRSSYSSYSYSSEYINAYSFDFQNALFSDKLYFTVNNRIEAENGETVIILDTSEIPGGYGIYSVPFADGDIQYEEMKTEYPIDPNSSIIYFDCNTERDVLYLSLRVNDTFVFKVIDRKTMQDISSLELFTLEDYSAVHYQEYEDFFVFYKNEYEIKVVKRGSDGTYSEALSLVIPEENEIGWEYFPYDCHCAFDSERLIIFTKERQFTEEPNFSLTAKIIVLTSDGIAYSGKWECSLGNVVQYIDGSVQYSDYKIKITA